MGKSHRELLVDFPATFDDTGWFFAIVQKELPGLVNIQKAMERSTIEKMGKFTIHGHVYNSNMLVITRGYRSGNPPFESSKVSIGDHSIRQFPTIQLL